MTANSKWITIESLEEPVTRVARRALKARLQWFWRSLPPAAEAADKDPEHVHQLRVASRRATAAMETFAAYLPRRRAAWFDRQLKRIRRAAGDARDLDVLALRLQNEFHGDMSDAVAAILWRVSIARKNAQPEIVDVFHRLQSRKFRRRIRKLVRRVRLRNTCPKNCSGEPAAEHNTISEVGNAGDCNSEGRNSAGSDSAGSDSAGCDSSSCKGDCCRNDEPSIFNAAREQMHGLVGDWFAAAESDLSDTHRLHLFRIAGKRLRYAMEIFAGALGSNCRKVLYPKVEQILEQLGQINDHVASQDRFQVWLDETERPDQRALLTRLLSSDAQAIDAGLHAFFQLWTHEHRDALRAQFARELADK
jgi:CHAD domain-containing protein